MTARIIVIDPFAQTTSPYDVPAGGLLSDALMQISPSRWNGSAFEIYEGAVTAAGLTPVENARDIVLQEGQVWQIVVVPAEPVSAALIVAAGVTATSAAGVAIAIAVHVAVLAITMGITYLAQMLLAPGKQSNRSLSSDDQPSGLNNLSLPKNAFRLGSRIAEIYGTMRFWPDLIFSATTRWDPVAWDSNLGGWGENPTATSSQAVRAVYCLGRGAYQLSNFQFADSPISAANGSVTIYPPGVMLPDTITATYAVATLSSQELGGPNSPNMWSPWYEIPADTISRFDVQVFFPAGLIRTYSGKKVPPGYVEFQTANIRIEAERLGDNDVVLESVVFNDAVSSKTRNQLRITLIHAVNTGRWRVRVAETQEQPPFPNGNTETVIKKTNLEGIIGHRVLSPAERVFQHETVIVVEASNLGGAAIQNMENFNLLATRVLPTQDVPGVMTEPRADGRWITAAIHTLTDPYLCNYAMNEVDWHSLHAVQASLDAYGEPFGESGFHAALDRQMSADEQLMQIARKARAQVFPSGGLMTFARDERRAGVSALFNRRNRLVDRAAIGLGLQFAGRDDNDGVIVSFIDADNGYRQDTYTYTYPTGTTPASPLTIDLLGAVHKWEVCRRARFEMAQIQYRRRSMPLRVTEEGQLLMPFDRVAVVLPWDEGVSDGEVLEIDNLDLRLSRVVPEDLTADARIRLRSPDGRQTTLIPVVANTVRGPDWVTIPSAPAFTIFGPNDDRQLGTLYSLSLNEASDTATNWILTGAEVDDQGVSLTLREDADEVFQLSDDVFDPCTDEPPEPPVNPVVAAFQWRVWMTGAADGSIAEANVRIANIEMATSTGGPDISSTGVTYAPPNVTQPANAFDGNVSSVMATTVGDALWVKKTFPAKTLLTEMRLQANTSFISSSVPQCVIIQKRDADTDTWDTVHVSTGVVWVTSEWKTFKVDATVRSRGEQNALAWRARWTKDGVDGVPEMEFVGITNARGQSYANTSYSSENASNAFDGNIVSDWSSTAAGESRIGQVMGTPQGAIPNAITMTGYASGSALTWTPTQFDVEWTDDMEVWNFKATVNMSTWTGPPALTQTVSI